MKQSQLLKSFSLRTFLQSLFFSTLLFAVIACFYWQSQDMDTPLNLREYASLFVFLLFFGLLQWMFQKNTLFKLADASWYHPSHKKRHRLHPDNQVGPGKT